jgi:hypothetical protein
MKPPACIASLSVIVSVTEPGVDQS